MILKLGTQFKLQMTKFQMFTIINIFTETASKRKKNQRWLIGKTKTKIIIIEKIRVKIKQLQIDQM